MERLAVLSVGSPAAFANAGSEQREKSWYMLLFQFAGVAERWLSADNFRNFREWTRHPDGDAVAARLSEPGALTASLAIYRANMPPEVLLADPPDLPPVQAARLGIWSSGDPALTERAMAGSGEYVAGAWRYERLEGAGHWMMLEAPDRVNTLLRGFLAGEPAPAAPDTATAS